MCACVFLKLEDGEIVEDAKATEDVNEEDYSAKETLSGDLQKSGWPRRDGNQRAPKKVDFFVSYSLGDFFFFLFLLGILTLIFC